jgi:predicted nucleic acid-binding protein
VIFVDSNIPIVPDWGGASEQGHGAAAPRALHAAIMERHEVTRLLSFDSAFDSLHWIERLK